MPVAADEAVGRLPVRGVLPMGVVLTVLYLVSGTVLASRTMLRALNLRLLLLPVRAAVAAGADPATPVTSARNPS